MMFVREAHAIGFTRARTFFAWYPVGLFTSPIVYWLERVTVTEVWDDRGDLFNGSMVGWYLINVERAAAQEGTP